MLLDEAEMPLRAPLSSPPSPRSFVGRADEGLSMATQMRALGHDDASLGHQEGDCITRPSALLGAVNEASSRSRSTRVVARKAQNGQISRTRIFIAGRVGRALLDDAAISCVTRILELLLHRRRADADIRTACFVRARKHRRHFQHCNRLELLFASRSHDDYGSGHRQQHHA